MMKKLLLLLLLSAALLCGCTGKIVVDTGTPDIDRPASQDDSVKTGLALITTVSKSMHATPDSSGSARTDVTMVALTVDSEGVIRSCTIDGVTAAVPFDDSGQLLLDDDATFATKNELGDDYGMHKASPIGKEWDEQAAAFAAYAVGKRADELTSGDVTASVTVSTDEFIRAIRSAADTAVYLGAQTGDRLALTALCRVDDAEDAEDGANGVVRCSVSAAAVTMQGETVTSCLFDGVQTRLTVTAEGVIPDDLSAPQLSKNRLGDQYGMAKASSIGREWYRQAAAFAAYAVGKTPRQLTAIPTDDDGHPTGADLVSSVTISVSDFQALVLKAAGGGA